MSGEIEERAALPREIHALFSTGERARPETKNTAEAVS